MFSFPYPLQAAMAIALFQVRSIMKLHFLRRSMVVVVTTFMLMLVFAAIAQAAEPAPAVAEAAAPPVHVVERGETLAAIAARYGVTVTNLMRWNSLRNPNVIYAGQRLIVGQNSAAGAAPAAGGGVHVVLRGQTLGAIARKYGVSVEALRAANGLRGDVIFVGQRLRIPAAGAGTGTGGSAQYHVVQSGETLEGIARRYGTTANSLAKINNLANASLIRIGQRLLIAGSAEAAQPAVRGRKKIVVDISEQRCWRYEGEVMLNTWRCSTGRNNSTATGNFRVQSKLRRAFGSTWNIWMPYWLGIYWAGSTENGIHGLPWEATTGRRTWAGLVGTPITYGCVMLNDAVMKEMWEWADIGTAVVIKQ